jgi:hypothetical protein
MSTNSKGYGSIAATPYVQKNTRSQEDADSLEPLIENQEIFSTSLDDVPFMSNPMRKASNKKLVSQIHDIDQHFISQEEIYADSSDLDFVPNPLNDMVPPKTGPFVQTITLKKLDMVPPLSTKRLTKIPRTQVVVVPDSESQLLEDKLVDDVYRQVDFSMYLGKNRFRLYGLLFIAFMVTLVVATISW